MKNKIATRTVADFFAGIGLVTLGFKKAGWETTYALDYDPMKELQYTTNFGSGHFRAVDIANEKGKDVPNVTLAHASFPCTDLSLAGGRKGINAGQSSAFWQFARILSEMKEKHGNANPNFVLLENVEGLLTANDGLDLRAILEKLNELDYRVDLMRIDGSHFVPQSRVRIFIVGVHNTIVDGFDAADLIKEYSLRSSNTRPAKILNYVENHQDIDWYFHNLPNLPVRKASLSDIIDEDAEWWPEERTLYLLNQLHAHQKKLLDGMINAPAYTYLSGFRRMRMRDGRKQSTVELRNDGIAGCLRTPKGGSARQIIVRVGKKRIEARLFNGVEAGRLMGASDFILHPKITPNQALFGFGDAVCVPVLEWLANYYFDTLLESQTIATHAIKEGRELSLVD